MSSSVSELSVSESVLLEGQGDYIVYRRREDEVLEAPHPEVFARCYQILNENLPIALVHRGRAIECAERYTRIQKLVKEIDPTLGVAFVPKTLYELGLIKKLIKEDLINGALCPKHIFNAGKVRRAWMMRHLTSKRECLHLLPWVGDRVEIISEMVSVAYRLNNAFIKKLSVSSLGFSFPELLKMVNKKITFLENYYRERGADSLIHKDKDSVYEAFLEGPTISFGLGSEAFGSIPFDGGFPSGLVRKGLEFDCSELSRTSFVLYRGGNFSKDLSVENEGVPYSSSFGTSLFAGICYDTDATAFYHMCKRDSNAYAIVIPYDELPDSDFYIPLANTLQQLCGKGEFFHARTKVWKEADSSIGWKGIDWGLFRDLEVSMISLLKSDHSRDELSRRLIEYKQKAVIFK